MPKPYHGIKPPFTCPWCLHVSKAAKEHKKHLAEHEREQMKGRNCYISDLEKFALEREG